MLWDFFSQIRKVLFDHIPKQSNIPKHPKKMGCGAKILFVVQKIQYDAHEFFDQSTLEMVTYVFLLLECIKYVQTMHNQFLLFLVIKGKIRGN